MIGLKAASRRNTKAHWVRIGSVDILFSYETPVALCGDGVAVRVENSWGPTTGRHMNEAGVRNFRVVSDDDLDWYICQAVVNTGRQHIASQLREPLKKAA